MKKSKVFSLLLAGLLSISAGVTVVSATEGDIADMQAWKQDAEEGLAQARADISSLESKKQELESYLAELDAQYEELTESISELSIEAAEKEEELKKIRKDLKKARKKAKKQYEAMKLRIAYMYENGGATTLELLLSSGNFAEFLNRTENVTQIAKYDRDMLEKYEVLRESIKEKEAAMEEESEAIEALMNERAAKKQEVQELAAGTNDNISYYIGQISASEEEAAALMAEISNAEDSIAALMQQAAEEAAREEAENQEDYEESYEDSGSEGSAGEYEESEYDDSEDAEYEGGSEESEDNSGKTSGSSEGGSYLGNFKLTAYCNCAKCCGTAGNLTASGTVPTAGRTVAMAGVPFGTKLSINGNVYTVEDLGTPYGHVDIFFNSHSEALSFGLQYAEVYQLS